MSRLSPQTLTTAEQEALLRASARQVRDHVIFSMALGTGLRLGELVGLNVGDVFFPDGRPRVRIRLRAEIVKGGRAGDAFLPDSLVRKLGVFWSWKRARMESTGSAAPLFCSQSGFRVSKRRVQMVFRSCQERVGFDRLYPFHALRHSAVTAVYKASRDLFLAQRFARHVSPLTTVIYTHPSDDELLQQIRNLHC